MSIRQTLVEGLRRLSQGARDMVLMPIAWLEQMTASDLLAVFLIVTVVVLVLWRQKQRMVKSTRLTRLACPDCGGEIHRIRRHWYDRVIALYVPVRRYQCKDHDCQWRGLRVHRSRYQ
jgi:hypothetical protein